MALCDLIKAGVVSLFLVSNANAVDFSRTVSGLEQKMDKTSCRLMQLSEELSKTYEITSNDKFIIILGDKQKLYLVSQKKNTFSVQKEYVVSTGSEGFSIMNEFGKTPVGMHYIKRKYGEDAPIGTVFDKRKPMEEIMTNLSCTPYEVEAKVLTRVLRLSGLDLDNRHTWEEKIYIHGTNKEHKLGKPASHGCIRMYNTEVVELFDSVKRGTLVYIAPK